MGIVWEAYHKGVPSLGVPEISHWKKEESRPQGKPGFQMEGGKADSLKENSPVEQWKRQPLVVDRVFVGDEILPNYVVIVS